MNICVFLGASSSDNALIVETVKQLGLAIVKNKHTLVYGAASGGLMGELADVVINAGGEVTGVMAKSLSHIEETHAGLTETHIVEDITHRKSMLFELGDLFITLPGGLGTMEELFDLWSALKIKTYSKPLYLLDPVGFYNNLMKFTQDMVSFGMVKQADIDRVKLVRTVNKIDELFI